MTEAEQTEIFWQEVADEAEEHVVENMQSILIEGHLVVIGYHNDSYMTPWQVWKFGIGTIASDCGREEAIAHAQIYLREHAEDVIKKVSSYWSENEEFFLQHHAKDMCPLCIQKK